MSASLVRKSLAIIDEDFNTNKEKGAQDSIRKKNKKIDATKHNHQNREFLSCKKRLTVAQVRKSHTSKEKKLKETLEKLKEIREVCRVDLDKLVTKEFLERAVTRRPIRKAAPKKKKQKTAFTEEDFANFEAEYFDES